jgi:TonB family protein
MAVKPDDRSRRSTSNVSASGAGTARRGDRSVLRPGDTLPPTPVAALLAAGGADLLVLSTDAQLIDTATRASRELRVWPVANWLELEAALAVTRRAVVLVDADLLGDAVHRRLVELDAYSHKAVTLVAAERSAAEGLMGLLSERKIHRLLIKPSALGITRLLIESAAGRCLRLADAEAPREPIVVARPRSPMRPVPVAAPRWVLVTAGTALLAGVTVIAGVSAWWRSPANDGGLQASQATELDAATVAMQADSAAAATNPDQLAPRTLDDYLAVLAVHPTDAAAGQKVDAIVGALYAEAETALLASDYATAAAALADVRRADPTSSRLAFLEAQVERARQASPVRRGVEETPPTAIANTELSSLVTIARARIQRGKLLDPLGDSALEYISRAERLAPHDADLSAVRNELAAALLAAAHGALAESDVVRASAFTRQAASSGADSAEVARLESELAVAWAAFSEAMTGRIAAALVARDWAKAEEGLAALADAPNGAPAGERLRAQLATAKLEEHYLSVVAPASELELLDRVALVYPVDAARDGIEGWVDVEFVVDVTGQPRDFEVVAAEPKGRFEDAALAALSKYRYRPFTRDERPFARRLRLRIRFALQ